ncbi:MAG: DEAD/DEAH box helicase [Candidatus Gastranaerophilales bacterium]|nr:DEAD/DEAH box helicase [Candidatus Gastranaerophilales bacterium]
MLSPVKNIQFKSPVRHTFSSFIGPETLTNKQNINSIYDNNSISFAHYMGLELSDDKVLNPTYYKLPKIELEGRIHQFRPDTSQMECASKLLEGKSVLYCAPTGTGKTAVAHFAVNKNLDENKRTIITVPLVALANDKYREFSKIYGKKNVGIMTGDRKINPNAPIVIMTTEILYNQSADLGNNNDIGTVVFDEAHYISDEDRGSVWENSIIACVPNDIQILCLSATINNGNEFSGWIQSLNTKQDSSLVEIKPKERYVPLVWQIFKPKEGSFEPVIEYQINLEDLSESNIEDKQKRAISKIYQKQNNKDEFYKLSAFQLQRTIENLKVQLRPKYDSLEDFKEDFARNYPEFSPDEINEISHLLRNEDSKQVKHIYSKSEPHDNFPLLVKSLNEQNMLPALIFKLSRNMCDDVVKNLYLQGVDLTTQEEKEQIREIIEQYANSGYLGKDINPEALIRGYGAHHAGKLPQYRKLVEELFSKKLLKVVSATSTLSAGINMPARSVVISDMTYKSYNAHTKEMETTTLSVNDFHQMAGRAGRRGVDNTGNVVLYNLKSIPKKYQKEQQNIEAVDELNLAYQYISSNADNLRSQFRPDPVLIARYYNENSDNSNLRDMVNNSFKIYSAKDKDKTSDTLIKRFENYSHILLKQGFLYRNYKNEYILTPKGRLLLCAQGANPLMTVGLIYDEVLKNITPETLAQIAGYIAGSNEVQEPKGFQEVIDNMLEIQLTDRNSKQQIKSFRKVRNSYQDREEKLLRTLKESKIAPNDIISSDNVSGYILYLWAHFNSSNPDTIENFEKISSVTSDTQDKDIKRALSAKLSQGNVYRSISHSVSVLKQIQRICDYALSDNFNYPNSDYYETLKNKASLALELINKEPVRTEDIQ